MGLRSAPVLFLIVLPQALRIMVPQLTSQYLNLIKSSTLGAAVAYPEIFQIFAGTVMNQANKEVETIIIVMAVFLTINLLASAFMNWYNGASPWWSADHAAPFCHRSIRGTHMAERESFSCTEARSAPVDTE